MLIYDVFRSILRSILNKVKNSLIMLLSPRIFDTIAERYRYPIKYRIRKYFYYGKNYYCPCCGHFVKGFASFGKPKRLNAECPFCYAMERHRSIYLYLLKKTNLFNSRINFLDIGPEYYLQIIFKSISNLNYISVDINPKNAMYTMDVSNLKFDDDYFDISLCMAILEHVKDDIQALNEIFRVLKPEGCVIIQVPINETLEKTEEFDLNEIFIDGKEYRPYDYHVRDYGRDFKERVEGIGFLVKIIETNKDLGVKEIKKFGLRPIESFYFCLKPIKNDKGIIEKSNFKLQ